MLGVDNFEPERLKLARQMYNDLSKASLADILNVSPSTITKWEDGTHKPQANILQMMSDFFQIPVNWFLRPSPNYGSPLFLNRAKKRVLLSACTKSNTMLLNLAEIHSIANEWVGFPKLNLIPCLNRKEALSLFDLSDGKGKIQKLTEELRKRWGLGISPIINLTKSIEKSGVIVTRFEIGSDEMDGTSAWINNHPYIFIASDKQNFFRSRFDLAHELGHIIMHKELTEADKKARFDELEEQAHYFASCLLFPVQAFVAEVGHKVTLESLIILKKRWGVSIAAMLVKSRQLNLISEEHSTRLWRSYRYRGFTKCEPLDAEKLPEEPSIIRETINLLLNHGGFAKENLIDKFGLKKHLELLAGLPKGFLDDDFGQIISIKQHAIKNSKKTETNLFHKTKIIEFSRA
ncbi:helix-turn-helix domain-containing protein [Acinetobacter sp. ANC 5502]